ncbi:MAG TPA: thrombospondin type 3 repeat-containing protein [Kiritimatiellia bacterium]|nr:thrombospondin type 3 repeat-containing protein [Kiritimatiellia bacterium]HSA18866.1 thrombospondin type 3 repeat-containing protein [Kiritimatiellia bacterium]
MVSVPRWRSLLGRACVLGLMAAAIPADAVKLRVASFNVYYGINTDTQPEDYDAVKAILQRINPDIVGFCELIDDDYNDWVTLAAELNYPYLAYGTGGTYAGTLRMGFYSRYPITASYEVKEPTGAKEMTRWPLHIVVDVPGALNPFNAYVIHNKSASTSADRFRRAIEIMREITNIAEWCESYPLDTEYVIMGDWNEDVRDYQPASFDTLPTGLPTDYTLGTDIVFSVKYKLHPTDRPAEIEMGQMNIYQEGGTNVVTYPSSGRRLDYIFFSDEIMNSPYGAPAGEVYNSAYDAGGGLPKYGSPLPAGTSTNASDHLLLFSDINLIDALPCLNPVAYISEVVDHPTNAGANYVELYNSGTASYSLTNYSLVIYRDGVTALNIPLSKSIGAGQAFVIAARTSDFQNAYGAAADLGHTNLLFLNGNDVVALKSSAGNQFDIYGVPGEPASTNDYTMSWAYRSNAVYRKAGVCDPLSEFDTNEWTLVAGTSATPKAHVACNQADVLDSALRLIPSAPYHTTDVVIAVNLQNNLPASNLAATAYYSIAGGAWASSNMTAGASNQWQTGTLSISPSAGDSFDYYVQYTFQGTNAVSPGFTHTNQYAFPASASASAQPFFNEVRPDDASTDDIEFYEIIAPAGTNLYGYEVWHWNGSDGTSTIWRVTLPSFTVPNDGITDTNGAPLGFFVVGMNNATNPIPNVDMTLHSSGLQNGPDGLILFDPSGSILDAIAWAGSGTNIVSKYPSSVATNIPPGRTTYLHILPTDSGDDTSLQAPNNVFGNTGNWTTNTATPGAINGTQTSGNLVLSDQDTDGDSFLDSEDNCPDTWNPIQSDNDGDGQGDACDDDIDNDGVSNASDNCPYTYNPTQTDTDGDGAGDACDTDADNDGIDNEEDNCPTTYNPDQANQDGDGQGDACDDDRDGDGVANASDNCPDTFNAGQENTDGDSYGNACDTDTDNDGVPDELDNCPNTSNPGQEDTNGDGIGDACTVDADADGVHDSLDNCVGAYNPTQADADRDGIGDACDDCVGGFSVTNLIYESFSSEVLPTGWTLWTNVGTARWRFDNPRDVVNGTGGTNGMAIADSRFYSKITMDVELRTPVVNLESVSTVQLQFKTDFDWYSGNRSETCTVYVSRSGLAGPWSNIWQKSYADYRGPVTETFDLTGYAAGYTGLVVRFRYANARNEMFWQVDDVVLHCETCDTNFDSDSDGYVDVNDNCPFAANANQADLDNDGYGDACDDDIDGDGIPNDWETPGRNLSPTNAADAALDNDEDGFDSFEEYMADTDPEAGDSLLFLDPARLSGQHARLGFLTSTNRRYQIMYKAPPINSTNRWAYLDSPFQGPAGSTTYTDTTFSAASVTSRYYRVRVWSP